jgi:group II intron reverse transcriptase/maturase
MAFTSLNHYLDYEWLYYAFEQTRKDGATGVDGQTAAEYAANLEQNLRSLIERIKLGSYQAPPTRRHYIPKSDGTQRGLGIPCFEDKVAQRAIVMLLEPIYEQEFMDCSYGFRPGRSAHQALRAVYQGIMEQGGRWVLDVDIRKYFDSIPFAELRGILGQRVTDGVVRKMIDKWLKAGVLDDGRLYYPDSGTPQGGVLSPLLSNIYLHQVLDRWFAVEVQPRLRGPSTLIRYCDDFVMLFAYKDDAERVLAVLGKRLGKYGLQLHPDKTRLVDFRYRPAARQEVTEDAKLATSFNFLGFTHVWVIGRWKKPIVRQTTAKDRFARTLKTFNQECRNMRHEPLREQHTRLCRKMRGHFAYFGISGNYSRLAMLRHHVARCWHKWLSRRSTKSKVNWAAFRRLLDVLPLPPPRIIHHYAVT